MTPERKLSRWRLKLEWTKAEHRRQVDMAGERLGVFQRLRELAREERRIERIIEKLIGEGSRT